MMTLPKFPLEEPHGFSTTEAVKNSNGYKNQCHILNRLHFQGRAPSAIIIPLGIFFLKLDTFIHSSDFVAFHLQKGKKNPP